jgi:HSP20 family protein
VNWHLTPHPNLWRPPTDVFETEDRIVVRVEIGGMHEGEFVVNFDQGILFISGLRPEVPEKRAFHQMEIHFGEFLTEVEIPVPIDIEKIEAIYQDGFLRVNLPKALPRQIKITQE